jgi:hypothetical protein
VKVHARSEISGAVSVNRNSNSKLDVGPSWATLGAVDSNQDGEALGLHPNVPYQPVPGLVALFARAAASSTQNPRAPHSRSLAATDFSYATIIRSPTNSGRFNSGNRGTSRWYVGSLLGQTRDSILGMLGVDPIQDLVVVAMEGAEDQVVDCWYITLALSCSVAGAVEVSNHKVMQAQLERRRLNFSQLGPLCSRATAR